MRAVHTRKQPSTYQFDLSGGALCLDFANTVSHRHLPQRRAEHLDGYADLVAFAEQSKLLLPKLAASLRARSARNGAEARSSFRKSIALREGLYRAFIRECGAPDCEWLFLDQSRNGSRRWCDMKSCGNRQKARRHYQRTHE